MIKIGEGIIPSAICSFSCFTFQAYHVQIRLWKRTEGPDHLEINWLEKEIQANPKKFECTLCKYLYTPITFGYQTRHGKCVFHLLWVMLFRNPRKHRRCILLKQNGLYITSIYKMFVVNDGEWDNSTVGHSHVREDNM